MSPQNPEIIETESDGQIRLIESSASETEASAEPVAPEAVETGESADASSWDDLTDGSIAAPIDIFEDGTQNAASTSVFTGTNTDGTSVDDGGNMCEDWTIATDSVAEDYSVHGASDATTGEWSWAGALRCSETGRLFCFEDPDAP